MVVKMENADEFQFASNFVINNDQGLEEEELQDRKRRQDEIHNLLSRAMGNCSLTDDSSVDTSTHTIAESFSDAPIVAAPGNMEKQYLESNVDDQLKVLYEIRCREVKELDDQLQKVKSELHEHQKITKTKIALQEYEIEGKCVSLREIQCLLVEKTEQINELNKQLNNMKYTVECLEGNLAEISDEKEILRQLNLSLEQQIHLMEKNGFPLMNKSSDRELRESLNNKIKQLELSLEGALKQNEQRVQQHSELVHGLKQTILEKDNHLAEKGFVINKLTQNFEAAQLQCHELMKTVGELRENQREANDSLNRTTPLDLEMRKLRNMEVREEIKREVAAEFQTEISLLITENNNFNEKLLHQKEQLEDAVHRAEIISIIENEKSVLQSKLIEVEDMLQSAIDERNKYHEKCKEAATNSPQIANISLQTSFAPENLRELEEKENERIQELELAQICIKDLEAKLILLQKENSHLKVKEELEQGRDDLIKKLQEKAKMFEKIIFENQQAYLKQHNEKTSIGVNTEQYDANNSLLKLKYDTLLYQREIDVRNALEKEFEVKQQNLLAKFKPQFAQAIDCKDCNTLKLQIKEITKERHQDRMAVLKMIDIWQHKFEELETNSSGEKYVNYMSSIDQQYSERFKILAQMLQEQFLKEIKQQELKINLATSFVNNKIKERINKVIAKVQEGDFEVKEISERLKVKHKRKK